MFFYLRKWWALSVRKRPFPCVYKDNGRPMNMTWERVRLACGRPRRRCHHHLHVPPVLLGVVGKPMGGER